MILKYPPIERGLPFPEYISHCFYVKGYISRRHGVAIEFIEPTGEWEVDSWRVDIEETDERVEDIVLPLISEDREGFFEIAGEGIVIESLNLIDTEFFHKYKEIIQTLSKATNFLKKDPGWFVRVKAGDVKLIDVGVACIVNDVDVLKKIKFLWIIGTNNAIFFTENVARRHAISDVQRYLSRLIPRIPISLLLDTIKHYLKLIHSSGISEEEILQFLSNNPCILSLNIKQIEYKPKLGEGYIPDFLVETSTGEFVVIEVEHPQTKLFTRQMDETKELRRARTQIEEYLSFIRNNILYFKQRYPTLSVEKLKGLIVIGLSSSLNKKEKERLNCLNYTLKDYKVSTFDELAERLLAFLENLGVRYGPFG